MTIVSSSTPLPAAGQLALSPGYPQPGASGRAASGILIAIRLFICFLLGADAAWAYTNEVYLSGSQYTWKVNNVVTGTTLDLATAVNNCFWQSNGEGREIHILIGGDMNSTIGIPGGVQVYCHGNSFAQTHSDPSIFFAKGVSNVGIHDMIITTGGYMPLKFTRCNNISLSGITILGGYIGIRIESHESRPWQFWNYGLTVTDCRFENLGSHGMETYGIDGVTVDNIVARNNGECGVLFNKTKNATVGTVDAYRCSYGGGYAGLRFANGCSDCRVKYLKAVECGRGFFTVSDAKNIIVEEVYIRDCTSHAILIQNSDGVGINSGSYNGTGLNHYTSINSWILARDVTNVITAPPSASSAPSSSVSTSGVLLSWPAVAGATNYLLQRSTISGGPYSTIAYLDTTSFVDRNVAAATYYYVVRAVGPAGPGPVSVQTASNAIATTAALGSGLQIIYPFNGSTADSQGGPALSLAGPPAFVPGLLSQALAFDGSANYGTMQSLSGSNFREFSVATWAYLDSATDWQRIFDFGSSNTNYMAMMIVANTLRFEMYLGNSRQAMETPIPPLRRWVHLAVTFSGNWATIYLNGAPVKSIYYTFNPTQFTLTQNYLGKSRFSDPLFKGQLDDFRLYNRGLSAAEVSTLVTNAPSLPPYNLVAGSFGTKVALTWEGVVNATSYNVKRATASGGPYTAVATGLSGTSYWDTSVVSGEAYYYVVTGSNANGESVGSNEATAVVSDLVARVKFDEFSGTVAVDTSGNSWNATLVNGTSFTPGVLNNALDFANTAAQHATLPAGIGSGLNDYTVSCWVKIRTFANFARVFDFGSGTTNYMFLTPQFATGGNSAKMRFAIRTPSTNEQQINSSIALPLNTWVHVAVTLSGSTGRLYLNGSLAGTNSGMTLTPSSLGITTQNYLGRSQFADPYLDGSVDDFRLYARALTATELAALANPIAEAPASLAAIPDNGKVALTWELAEGATSYNVKRASTSGGPYTTIATVVTGATYEDNDLTNDTPYYYVVTGSNSRGESAAKSPEASATPSTLRLYLKFDDDPGMVAADSSGRGTDAALVNAPSFVTGRIGGALGLVQASSQHATLPAGMVSDLTTATIMSWVKIGGNSPWQRIFDFGTGSTNYMFLTTQYDGTARMRFAIRTPAVAESAANQINSSVALTVGGWAHVAVVLNGSTGTLYLNGVQVGQSLGMTLNPASLGATTLNYLGKSQFNDPYLNGSLDDFRIYGRAMSQQEVALFASPLAAPQSAAAASQPLAIGLSWGAVSNAATYTVKFAEVPAGPYTTLASGLTSPGYTHGGLAYGATYYYVVNASNGAGPGPDSTEVTASAASTFISAAERLTPSFAISNGNQVVLTTATSAAGHLYQLQASPDLAPPNWTNVGAVVNGTGSVLQIEAPYDPAVPRRFYRILISR